MRRKEIKKLVRKAAKCERKERGAITIHRRDGTVIGEATCDDLIIIINSLIGEIRGMRREMRQLKAVANQASQ